MGMNDRTPSLQTFTGSRAGGRMPGAETRSFPGQTRLFRLTPLDVRGEDGLVGIARVDLVAAHLVLAGPGSVRLPSIGHVDFLPVRPSDVLRLRADWRVAMPRNEETATALPFPEPRHVERCIGQVGAGPLGRQYPGRKGRGPVREPAGDPQDEEGPRGDGDGDVRI